MSCEKRCDGVIMADGGGCWWWLQGGQALYCDVSGLLELKKRDAGNPKARAASLQFARPSKVRKETKV